MGETQLPRTVFASDELDAGLDDKARFSLWRDIHSSRYGGYDMGYLTDRPFFARSTLTEFDQIGLAKFEGTISSFARTSRQVAQDARAGFMLRFNCDRSTMRHIGHGREVLSGFGEPLFFDHSEPRQVCCEGESAWISLYLPQATLLGLVSDAQDLLCTRLDPALPSILHLRRYAQFLAGSDEIGEDPQLREHVGKTLLDLVALSLGASGDVAEVAGMRGLRAVRVHEIVRAIRSGFASPAFSPRDVAEKVGMSPRYVQNLLQETGKSFTERVMKLRMQKARLMLVSRRNDRLKVSEIAYACGFGEVSYFNQAFRRRFGAAPTHFRASDREDG
jgi:AraC-like DNA-binding protein